MGYRKPSKAQIDFSQTECHCVFHGRADGRLAGVGLRGPPGHRTTRRLPVMDAGNPALLGLTPHFVGLRAIGRIHPAICAVEKFWYIFRMDSF